MQSGYPLYLVAVTHKRNDQIADSMGVAPEMNTAARVNIQALVQQLGNQHPPVPLQANSTMLTGAIMTDDPTTCLITK